MHVKQFASITVIPRHINALHCSILPFNKNHLKHSVPSSNYHHLRSIKLGPYRTRFVLALLNCQTGLQWKNPPAL